jgi:hypothetical protein
MREATRTADAEAGIGRAWLGARCANAVDGRGATATLGREGAQGVDGRRWREDGGRVIGGGRRGMAEEGAGWGRADVQGSGEKVDQVFVSTSYFLGVETIHACLTEL